MTPTQVITAMFGEVVANTEAVILEQLQEVDPDISGIRFDYGHWVELTGRVDQINNNPMPAERAKSNNPMVLLLEDTPIERGNTGYYGTGNFTLLICKATQSKYTSQEREEVNFTPYLFPIYDELIHQIASYVGFVTTNQVPHTMTPRKWLGRIGLYGQEGNIMNDFLDAVEISNLRLTINNTNCLTPINIS